MKSLVKMAVASVLMAGLSSGQSQAATFSQVGDTGQTLDTAQVIPGGALPLDTITGILSSPNIVNLFRIVLVGGQTFSATTLNADTLIELPIDQQLGSPTSLLPDPQLFLFDADGKGIYGNDDSSFNAQASLPSGGFSPTAPGTYFLAITTSGYNPVSAGGSIFGDADANGIFAPTGLGAASSLTGFTGTGTSGGAYQITLTGATTSVAAVPEPSETLGMVAAGLAGIGYQITKSLKHRKRSKIQGSFTND